MNKINLSIGVIILLVLLLIPSLIFSQDYEQTIKEGIKDYKSGNYDYAYDLLILPAEQGDKIAQYYIGLIYYNGSNNYYYGSNRDYWGKKFLKSDHKKALKWFNLSANQGFDSAQFYIGNIYANGYRGVKQNFTKAFGWYLKAANQEMISAQLYIASMYKSGQGVEKNLTKAFDLYLRIAERGNVEAIYEIGQMYERGEGVEVNYSEALKYYNKAVEKGSLFANHRLGEIYYNGLGGVMPDYEKAFKYFSESSYLDNDMLFIMLQLGLGVDRDTVEARKIYKKMFPDKPINHMHSDEYVKSENKMIENKYNQLNKDYTIAQKKKYEIDEVEFNKGLEYYNSNNYEKAFDVFIGLSEYDYPRVHYFIGYMYLTGKGVIQNNKEGLVWIEKSVYGGDAWGQFALGTFYIEGFLVKKDIDKAKELLKKASDQGHEGAIEELKKLQ